MNIHLSITEFGEITVIFHSDIFPFLSNFKKSHSMLKMKQVAIEKKYFLKDARHSGHQMGTVVCSNLSFLL